MEHIRAEHGEEQPYFYFPRLGPKWGNKRFGACFGRRTKEFRLVWSRQFLVVSWLSNLPQSFLEGPGVKSEDRYRGDSFQDFEG